MFLQCVLTSRWRGAALRHLCCKRAKLGDDKKQAFPEWTARSAEETSSDIFPADESLSEEDRDSNTRRCRALMFGLGPIVSDDVT